MPDAGNEIARAECSHFEGLLALRELVLNRNRIAGTVAAALAGSHRCISKRNRLRDLSNTAVSDRLQPLFLGFNRIETLVLRNSYSQPYVYLPYTFTCNVRVH